MLFWISFSFNEIVNTCPAIEASFILFQAKGKAQDLGGSCAFIFSPGRQEPDRI